MVVFKSFLRLIRFPNLVIVALTQLLIYYRILLPNFKSHDLVPILPQEQVWALVLTTLLLTAGGYIINDIFDYEVDIINKASKVVVQKQISVQVATWLYVFFSVSGFMCAVYLAMFVGNKGLAALYPLAMGGLFLYSLKLKGMPLLGNLIVALFAAGVAWIVPFAEAKNMAVLAIEDSTASERIAFLLGAYYVFAFYSTFLRELVKDIEDIEGDRLAHLKTLPLVLGQKKTKMFAFSLGVGLFGLVLLGIKESTLLVEKKWALAYAILLLLPLVGALYLLLKAKTKQHFHLISQLLKFMMLIGVLALVLLKI